MSKILIIDDETDFRESISQRLKMRGYSVLTLPGGKDALKTVRADNEIDVVILDRKMPDMSGEEVLKEIKRYRPELQVIMLTGHGSEESAMAVGKLDAFAYMLKPVELDALIEKIEAARENAVTAKEKHEIPVIEKGSLKSWLIGTHNSRPLFIMLGVIIFAAILLLPAPATLIDIVTIPKSSENPGKLLGFSEFGKMKDGETIAAYYSIKNKLGTETFDENGKKTIKPLTEEESIFRAKVMLAVLIVAALFWSSGAVPIGITALFVGIAMYFFGVLKPDDIAASYAKDSVIFIFGVLAFSTAISKTGLDRRIGLLLLGSSKSLYTFLFLFLPMFGVACSFLSEHALIAFLMPVLMIVYLNSIKSAGVNEDYSLAVMLLLSVNFAANCGGPGSPAAGGRNAVMLGIISDYGMPPSFGEWVVYGLPFVPVMAIVIGLYFFIVLRKKLKVKTLNISTIVKQADEKIGKMTKKEYITSGVLVLLIFLWVTQSDTLGLGGPVILALFLLNVFRIIGWRDIAKIQWEVVALYAAATAMGKGLASTGSALFLAQSFIDILPEFLKSGEGLAIAASLFTGVVTNFMSDGATVSAIGPITVPMAQISGTSTWMIGLATAFASSFAHMFVIGTPNNAIVFTMARNPVTGKQLIKLTDFMKHGFIIWILSMLVLWFWIILLYWGWVGF